MIRHFLKRLCIFIIPIVIVFIFFIASALYLGEAIPIKWMIDYQLNADSKSVFQPWREQTEYKLYQAQARSPDIIVFGSSRMNFFRSAFANSDPTRFYNASVEGGNVRSSKALLDALIAQGTIPEVIIPGLDLSKFNANYPIRRSNLQFADISPVDSLRYSYAGVRRVSLFWFTKPIEMFGYLQNRTEGDIVMNGLYSLTNGRGILSDGSYYRTRTDLRDEEQWGRELEAFEEGNHPFTGGNAVNEDSLAFTEEILMLAEENDIRVIGILPPYSPYFVDLMSSNDDYDYQEEVIEALQTLFTNYEMPFYNFTDPRLIGGSEPEMLDLWHTTDLLSLRMYHHLLVQEPDILSTYSDENTLAGWIEQYEDAPLALFAVDLP